MLFDKPATSTVQEMLDKFSVRELIEFERFCRDNALWDQMRQCYTEKSRVKTSWYSGDGYGFVEASSRMKTAAPHKIFDTLVWLNGNRAAAITMACIQIRKDIAGKAFDLSSYVRLVFTAVKEESWKLASLDAIYEKDCLVPASPGGMEPPPGSRASYSNLISVLGSEGHRMNTELAGDDRPDLRDSLLNTVNAWLGGA